jgi:Pentapeptide repeats (8 copies)
MANLIGVELDGADLLRANLGWANLAEAKLRRANLSGADLKAANLSGANLYGANLSGANLSGANLIVAIFGETNLEAADLTRVNLGSADLRGANLGWANLSDAKLKAADLTRANLRGANLRGADLQFVSLVEADLTDADLTGCRIYGVSAWGLKLDERTKQQNLIITREDEPEITVDNIEVAQFIYLLLHNEKIRDVIDTIGKKAVLILGRFTAERKAVLDALREELRKRDYLPILFDFDKPASQDLTATVSTLAHLARFIIADITDPSSIPYELATVVPTTPVPVQPILLSGNSEFSMFRDLRRRHHWVLTTHRYDSQMQLIAELGEKVIHPAELKVQDLRGGTGPV